MKYFILYNPQSDNKRGMEEAMAAEKLLIGGTLLAPLNAGESVNGRQDDFVEDVLHVADSLDQARRLARDNVEFDGSLQRHVEAVHRQKTDGILP